jgi:cytoskeleton protein RodZ
MSNTIGETLKKHREEHGLTLQDISKATHIRSKYLEALENDQLDLLPSAVQGRGFLRLIADLLEIPEEPLIDAWDTGIVISSKPNETALYHQEADPLAVKNSGEGMAESLPKVTKTELDTNTDHPAVLLSKKETAQDSNTGTSEIFKNIGHTLQIQREKLGLSLEDIEQYTHIRQYYLKTIETGKMGDLPSSVQAKGMIQSYAQFMDLDSDELLLEYAEGLQTQRRERLAANPVTSKKSRSKVTTEKQPLIRRLLTPDLLIGSFVILVLVTFAIWSTSRVIARRNESAQANIPGISDMLAATSSQTDSALLEIAPSATVSMQESTEAKTTPTVPISDANPAEELISPTFVMIDNAPLQVYIIARQRAYLKVSVDGEREFDGRIVPGNAYPFSGNESIEVLSGNAAALQIFFNQIDLGTIGSLGQVVNLIFEEQGVITPTPQFTFTPTPTEQATITLEPTMTPETPTVTPFVPE